MKLDYMEPTPRWHAPLAVLLAIVVCVGLSACEGLQGTRSSKSIANEIMPRAIAGCRDHGGINDVTPIEDATDDDMVFCNDNTAFLIDG